MTHYRILKYEGSPDWIARTLRHNYLNQTRPQIKYPSCSIEEIYSGPRPPGIRLADLEAILTYGSISRREDGHYLWVSNEGFMDIAAPTLKAVLDLVLPIMTADPEAPTIAPEDDLVDDNRRLAENVNGRIW